jgi:hypothetical protein
MEACEQSSHHIAQLAQVLKQASMPNLSRLSGDVRDALGLGLSRAIRDKQSAPSSSGNILLMGDSPVIL